MTKCMTAASLSVLTLVAVQIAAGQNRPSDADALRNDLILIDKEWGKATTEGDVAKLGQILDDSFIAVDLSGDLLDKERYLSENVRTQRQSPNAQYQASDYVLRIVDPTSAVLVHRGTFVIQQDKNTATEVHRSMHVFARRSSGWRVVASTEAALMK